MTKAENVLNHRKMRNKLNLALSEVFHVQQELMVSKNISASNMAGKAYEQIHELIWHLNRLQQQWTATNTLNKQIKKIKEERNHG